MVSDVQPASVLRACTDQCRFSCRPPAANQYQVGINSTQQRLAVVERMYSGDLSRNYLGSLSILNPEVLLSICTEASELHLHSCLIGSVAR